MLVREHGSSALEMGVDIGLQLFQIAGVDPTPPLFDIVRYFVWLIGEKSRPRRIDGELTGRDAPIPETVVGSVRRDQHLLPGLFGFTLFGHQRYLGMGATVPNPQHGANYDGGQRQFDGTPTLIPLRKTNRRDPDPNQQNRQRKIAEPFFPLGQ